MVLFVGSAILSGRHVALGIGELRSHIEAQYHRDVQFPSHDEHDCLICTTAAAPLLAAAGATAVPEPDLGRIAPPVRADLPSISAWLGAHHSRSPPAIA